jgi:hypothetical protein
MRFNRASIQVSDGPNLAIVSAVAGFNPNGGLARLIHESDDFGLADVA